MMNPRIVLYHHIDMKTYTQVRQELKLKIFYRDNMFEFNAIEKIRGDYGRWRSGEGNNVTVRKV